MIDFYCGINEKMWNRHPVQPGKFACISPVYGATEQTRRTNSVSIPNNVMVIQDSGAFSDGPQYRLDFESALRRQINHAKQYCYTNQITHRASYDLLIDEVWTNGNRHKRRWTVADADNAIKITVAAAKYIRLHDSGNLILSAQGVDAFQYLECAQEIAPLLRDNDIFGLGGWCITGKMPAIMLPVFRETIKEIIPELAKHKIKRVHIWGVVFAPALGELLWMCDQFGMHLSTDSAGPTLKPVMGEWGYADWKAKNYKRPPVETRGLERARHVQATREWLHNFRSTKYYREPSLKPQQLILI